MPATHAKIDDRMHFVARVEVHPNERKGHVRVHLGCGMTVDTHEADLTTTDRWKTSGPAECDACKAVEAGGAPVVLDLGHTPPTTVEADLPTNMKCPLCSGEIRKRRGDEKFSCTGGGHEFTNVELMSRLTEDLQNLANLNKAK